MSKQNEIQNYINTIVGATVTTSSLCAACKCSLPTVLSFIKNNAHRFQKAGRGKYVILELSSANNHTITNAIPAPQLGAIQHEW